jgi:twinkle protein
MAGMSLKKNPAAASIPMEELKKGFDAVFSSDKFILLDHQGAVSDVSIIDKMEYMALSGCKFIIIDHITILVSEGAEGLTGNEAIDKMMNDLLRFVKKYDVWIGLVSHLRKTPTTGKSYEEGAMPNLDAIKGSGSIKQICFDIVGFARNLMEDDPERMNVIQLAVLKCRYTGLTGNAQEARYNYDTGRIESH